MIPSRSSLTVRNVIAEIGAAADWLEEFAEGAGIAQDVTSQLQVALDEVLTNIIHHGLPGAASGGRQIQLDVQCQAETVQLEISDDGLEFDPTRAAAGDGDGAAVRGVGGAGLAFLRAVADEIDYQRKGGLNCLVITKHLPPDGSCDGDT